MSIATTLTSERTVANLWIRIGRAQRLSESYQASIEAYEQALPVVRRLAEIDRELSILRALAANYASLGETELALEQYDTALPIARAREDAQSVADILSNTARLQEST